MNPQIIQQFQRSLPPSQLQINQPLAPHTTLKIGGPADLFFQAKTEEQLTKALQLAQKNKIDYFVIGWGSNILISDKGFPGLVIKNQTSNIQILGPAPALKFSKAQKPEPDRHEHCNTHGKIYQKFDDLNYDESHQPAKLIKVSSGVSLPHLLTWTLDHNLTGLQWYARIPGTLGGAIVNNLHGGSHFFAEILHQATILTRQNKLQTLDRLQLNLGYDRSIFQENHYIIINAILRLYQGDVKKAKQVSLEWARRKSHQPSNSAGCTFKNITHAQMKKLNYPTTGVGYIIEHILKWSGKKVGGAQISPKHHNFIINTGKATAQDVLKLIKLVKSETHQKTGLTLEPEIFFLGFSPKDLIGVIKNPLKQTLNS